MTVDVRLLEILSAAARGVFPPGDIGTEHLPSPSSPADAVLGFFAHHVVASDVDPDFVQHWVLRHPFAGSDVRFLTELADRLGTEPGVIDVVFAAFGRGEGAESLGLAETADRDHPRVRRALKYRDGASMRVFVPADRSTDSVVLLGRGLASRWEGAYEVDPGARSNGLGRRFVSACAALAPAGEPVFLQCSPGNVASMRAIEAAGGWSVIGSEVLFLRR